MTLALLITAATGAWAQGAFSSDPYTSTTEFNSVSVTSSMTLNINEGVIVTVNSGLTIEDGVTLTLTGGGRLSVYGKSGNWGRNASYEEGTLIVEATAGGDGKPAIILNGNAKIVIDNGEIYAEGGQGGIGGTDATAGINQPDGAAGNAFSRFPTIDGATLYYNSSYEWIKYTSGDQTLYNKMKAVPATFEVIIDNSLEQPTATFQMPQYDVTATYTLKRDLSVETQVTVGDGTDGVRYRVQKQGNSFVPVGLTNEQVMALFRVHDQIENEDLAPVQDYTVQIYAVDIEGQPTGTAMTFSNFTYTPGQYIVKAQGQGNYVGQTLESNIFTLYQGYEVTVPAGEFATFYKEEALGLGGEHYTAGAALYTITDVNGTTATATELEITTDEPPLAQVAPAYTPLLVYNGSDEDMRVLLIPTTSSATVSHFSGFTGSLESQTLWGGEGFYACNGKQFVYVKNDLTLPANKCCLKITSGNSFEQGSRSITIVFDDATGISHEAYKSYETYDWYDLNGRKLNGMPTKKGVYILNGKKVVVK